MQWIDRSRVPSRGWIRTVPAATALFCIATFGATWQWTKARPPVEPSVTPLGFSGDAISARARAVFDTAAPSPTEAMRRTGTAQAVFFRGAATPSVCVTGIPGRGVFYCPETGIAAFDLGYLESLVARLEADADLGVALVAARLAAEHRQRETGALDMAALDMIGASRQRRSEIRLALALQADCLTGAWVGGAGTDLGKVPADFWGRLLDAARGIGADFAASGRPIPPELDTFGIGLREAREAAFRRGQSDPAGAACPAPVTLPIR